MRISYLLITIAVVFSACSQNSGSVSKADRSEKQIRDQVISMAENYVMDQLKDANKRIDNNGIITIGDEQKRFIIDPAKIYTGLIDADSEKDAIISIFPFQGQYEVMTEHLIITKSDGKFVLIRVLESDMQILSIKDGVITANVPEHSRNNPLFNCASCWEVIKYQFRDGELIEMK